jgi:NAD(P)-dependent dehydrogenase (short-subunit alcohol dehydrogenase family)
MYNFKNKVVVVTGSSHGIGKSICEKFREYGAIICDIDVNGNSYFKGDIGDKKVLEEFVDKIVSEYGSVDFLINNAPPLFKGINEASYDDFEYALKVGVTAPFYLSKLLLPYFNERAVIINMSSSRDRMSQPQTESYTASKGAIAALTHSLAVSLAHKVRVNSISPGWINTIDGFKGDEQDSLQHPSGRIGKTLDIAKLVLFLCSSDASFINGENICVDGGMTKQMIYHDDHNWILKK